VKLQDVTTLTDDTNAFRLYGAIQMLLLLLLLKIRTSVQKYLSQSVSGFLQINRSHNTSRDYTLRQLSYCIIMQVISDAAIPCCMK